MPELALTFKLSVIICNCFVRLSLAGTVEPQLTSPVTSKA